jgi:hypothetical protein
VLLGLATAAALAAAAPSARANADAVAPAAEAPLRQGYLMSTGARGLLAEEEAQLLQLRRDLEGKVRRELEAEREAFEAEARTTSVSPTPFAGTGAGSACHAAARPSRATAGFGHPCANGRRTCAPSSRR